MTGRSNNTIRDFWKHCSALLGALYEEQESQSICRHLLESRLELDYTGLIRSMDQKLTTGKSEQLGNDLKKLESGTPLQHVLGEVRFLDCRIMVNCRVLIPRRETEEMVQMIIEDHDNFRGDILDVGTGTGCIAIALKKHLPGAGVAAIDASKDALGIAKSNANLNNVKVDLQLMDILKPGHDGVVDPFDLLVSNPPYVPASERHTMHRNVLDNDPHEALFVPDNDPLLFYRRLGELMTTHLRAGGYFYLEIHERYGVETQALLKQFGFRYVHLRKDLQGKDRFITGMNHK